MKLAAAERHADLYPDRHLNVFVPYQSHDLDYNVTRAVISTLRWSRPELTRGFVSELAEVEGVGEGSFHYDLQSCDYEDFDTAQASKQVLLGVSVAGRLAELPSLDDAERSSILLAVLRSGLSYAQKLEECRRLLALPDLGDDELAVLHHSLEELEDGCMPDGWVFSPEAGVCVLMECKLTRLLDLGQIQRYGEVYFDKQVDADGVVTRSWEDVARFFAAHRGDDDPRTAFLCGQLCDYLDLLGLSPFEGFKPYDFDPDAALEALPKFRRFAQLVHDQATEQGVPLAELQSTAKGVRFGFSDPTTVGDLRLDLLGKGLRLEHRAGDGEGGRASVDAILAATKNGEKNPLATENLPGLSVRIERLRSDTPDGEAFIERQTLSSELLPGEFGFVLSELRRQHPPADEAKSVTGHYRRATVSIGRVVDCDDALGDTKALIEQVLATLKQLAGVARKLTSTDEE